MKKMLLFLLAGSLLLLAGCEGPAGADGLLETNLVTGSFKFEDTSGAENDWRWFAILDENLDYTDGGILVSSGVFVPDITEYNFSLTNVPAGNYYLYVVFANVYATFQMGISLQTQTFENTTVEMIKANTTVPLGFYGTFSDAEVQALDGSETDLIHPTAPNVIVPERGWVDLEPFTLMYFPPV